MMRPCSLGEIAQLRQRAEIAVHAEDAVGDQQLARLGGECLDDGPRGGDVAMGKDLDGGPTQSGAVDDAGVVQLVGDDEVVFGEDGGHGSGVGGKPALEHDGGFGLLELGEPPLELHVKLHRTGDRSDRARSNAVLCRAPRAHARTSSGCVVSPR